MDQLPIILGNEIQWVVAEGLGNIISHAQPKRNFIELSVKDAEKSRAVLRKLIQDFKPDLALVFYAPWWVGYELFRAKVRQRIGRASQWHSFLFFNRWLRQKRSLSEKHEADYNRELVEYALHAKPEKTPQLKLTADSNRHLLEKFSLRHKDFFIIHPGMAGSALNWPSEKYNELIEHLVKSGIVVLTGTATDEKFLAPIKSKWQQHANIRILQNKLSIDELLSMLAMSKGLVAPSTGVLHLASSLGVNAVGIYSPILAHHPKRWGPRGSGSFLLPDVPCPALSQCLKEKCKFFNSVNQTDCMNSITCQQVLEKLTR